MNVIVLLVDGTIAFPGNGITIANFHNLLLKTDWAEVQSLIHCNAKAKVTESKMVMLFRMLFE